MLNRRRILFLVYRGFELLDLAGPAAVFNCASALSGNPLYEIASLSASGGQTPSSSGIAIDTGALRSVRVNVRDTILVVGSDSPSLEEALEDERLTDWLSNNAGGAERYGSVCTGSFLLASAGLLRGRTVATHWRACKLMARQWSEIGVDSDSIYVTNGNVWTSAGVTAGIDMCLAIVEQDHGGALKGDIARELVVHAHRPGNQSQYSRVLHSQIAGSSLFSDLIGWLEQNLDRPIRVDEMAERMAMSERSFHRKFTTVIGEPPGKFLESLRLDRAKQLLEDGAPVKEVSRAVGFLSESGFRTAFESRFRITPSMHRALSRGARVTVAPEACAAIPGK